ncbi:MAG: type II secretion system F family protein [Candidatus Omnitrophica bacterium]|nr:type II secretion system F family protein [Candidatus Omnitrophota bacterium]MBU0878995.1 type II secretion system F family protein [Candidatus Omnitrophota bacterium]MBU0896534.1 type II secretion system F family protein [Candidatus Omnitrophota bacterium]MBU1810183.1 type II secretion system F family protein [Candidatus Omnitrophota bacterium]
MSLSTYKAVKSGDETTVNRSLFKKKTGRASAQSVIVFTRQFATIVKAGVPIVEGLGVLAEQSEDGNLKNALGQVVCDIREGKRLSQAISRWPGVFSELYVNAVLAGETGGVLDKVLLKLASVLEEEQETQMNIKTALRYPQLVVSAMVLAFIILSIKVVPVFAGLYSSFKTPLPLPTQMMIGISELVRGPWRDSPNIFLKILWYPLFCSVLGSLFFFSRWLINTPRGRKKWDELKFKIIIVGKIYNKITMLRFSSMFSVLYQSGLPILKILDVVKASLGNVILSREMEKIKKDVAEGKGISGAILESKFFPRMVAYMIAIGEKTGSLSEMLDSLYEYFSLDVKVAIKNLITLIEPLLTVVLAVGVAFLAFAIFLPMWNLIEVFKQTG